jgi:hypothetical protein
MPSEATISHQKSSAGHMKQSKQQTATRNLVAYRFSISISYGMFSIGRALLKSKPPKLRSLFGPRRVYASVFYHRLIDRRGQPPIIAGQPRNNGCGWLCFWFPVCFCCRLPRSATLSHLSASRNRGHLAIENKARIDVSARIVTAHANNHHGSCNNKPRLNSDLLSTLLGSMISCILKTTF